MRDSTIGKKLEDIGGRVHSKQIQK